VPQKLQPNFSDFNCDNMLAPHNMNLNKKISIKILRVLEILEDLYTNLLIENVRLNPLSRAGAIMDLKSIKLYKSWANKYIYSKMRKEVDALIEKLEEMEE